MAEPAYGAPPQKKGLSTGWIIALVIGGSIFLLGGSCVAWVVYQVTSNPEVQNVFGAFGDATKVMLEAQKAPGTKELRDAGCTQAFALDMNKMAKISERFDASAETPPQGYMVTCEWRKAEAVPCDRLATIYATAASPADEFLFMGAAGNDEHSCSGLYDAKGALISRETPVQQ